MINTTSKQYRIQMEEAHDYDQKVYGMFERQEGMFQQEDESYSLHQKACLLSR